MAAAAAELLPASEYVTIESTSAQRSVEEIYSVNVPTEEFFGDLRNDATNGG